MKKKFVLASLLALTLSSCNWFAPKVIPSSLSLENIVSTYYVGDTFIAPDVYVIYSDNSRSGNVKTILLSLVFLLRLVEVKLSLLLILV